MTQQGKDWDQLLGRPPWVCGSLEKISNQNPGFLAPPSFLLRNNFTKGFSFNKGSRTGHVTFIHQSLSAFFPQHLHLGCFFLRSWEPPCTAPCPGGTHWEVRGWQSCCPGSGDEAEPPRLNQLPSPAPQTPHSLASLAEAGHVDRLLIKLN